MHDHRAYHPPPQLVTSRRQEYADVTTGNIRLGASFLEVTILDRERIRALSVLIVPKSGNWVYRDRPAGWNEGCDERYDSQYDRDRDERFRVKRGHSVEERR